MSGRYAALMEQFSSTRIAVVGDSMVDRFLWGRVDRISPEAPVPVVRLQKETVKMGGAANVAHNLRALGTEVVLISAVGQDEAAGQLRAMLQEHGMGSEGILACSDRPTTLKTRIIAHSQQVVRADLEHDLALNAAECEHLLDVLEQLGPFSGILLSDYGKGVLNEITLPRVIACGRRQGVIVTADPKNGDFRQYRGVTSLTPNQHEAEMACAMSIAGPQDLAAAGARLLDRTEAEAVLITRGEHGMALYEKGGAEHHLPTQATQVYDVTGAGDTVIATYTAALVAGASYREAAHLANHAAGLAVRELGTVAITAAQIAEAMAL